MEEDFEHADLDPYGVVGVARDATDVDIRRAYRRRALEWHPDKNLGDVYANARFVALRASYDILSNSSLRGKYDTRFAGDLPSSRLPFNVPLKRGKTFLEKLDGYDAIVSAPVTSLQEAQEAAQRIAALAEKLLAETQRGTRASSHESQESRGESLASSDASPKSQRGNVVGNDASSDASSDASVRTPSVASSDSSIADGDELHYTAHLDLLHLANIMLEDFPTSLKVALEALANHLPVEEAMGYQGRALQQIKQVMEDHEEKHGAPIPHLLEYLGQVEERLNRVSPSSASSPLLSQGPPSEEPQPRFASLSPSSGLRGSSGGASSRANSPQDQTQSASRKRKHSPSPDEELEEPSQSGSSSSKSLPLRTKEMEEMQQGGRAKEFSQQTTRVGRPVRPPVRYEGR